MSGRAPEAGTGWSILPGPADPDAQGLPAFLRGTVFTGSTAAWLLRNDGPEAARRVELLPEDPEQPLDGPLGWDAIAPGESVAFRAGRRLFGDNVLRVRWFQRREDSRYWRLVALPSR